MNNDTRWLTRLAIEQGLLTRQQAVQVRTRLGDTADLMTFAQDLIDSGIQVQGAERPFAFPR